MNEQDQNLLALFAQAEQRFDNDDFVTGVMSQIDRERHRIMLVWVTLGLFIVVCIGVFATPVIAAVSMVTQLLPASLVEVQADWLSQLVAPINSVAAAVALGGLGIAWFFRKIFR